MDRRSWWATVHGVTKVRHNLATKTTVSNSNIMFLSQLNKSSYFIDRIKCRIDL